MDLNKRSSESDRIYRHSSDTNNRFQVLQEENGSEANEVKETDVNNRITTTTTTNPRGSKDLNTMGDKLDDIVAKLAKNSDKLDNILTQVTGVSARVDTLEKAHEDLVNSVTYQEEDIEEIKKSIGTVQDSVLEMQATMDSKLDDLSNRSRRNNITLLKIPEGIEGRNIYEYISREIIGTFLELDPARYEIERAHRSGPKADGRIRPMHVRFLNWRAREEVLKTVPKKMKEKKPTFVITDDVTPAIRTKRRDMLPKLRALKAQPNVKVAFITRAIPPTILYKEGETWKTYRAD